MRIYGQNASFGKLPQRPVLGGTLDGERPLLYRYWRTGYGEPKIGDLPFWVHMAGEYHCKRGYSTDDHDPNAGLIQFFYLTGGKGVCRYKAQRSSMQHGDLLIVPRYTDHHIQSEKEIQYHWLALGGEWSPSLLTRVGQLSVGYDVEIERLFVELRETLILRQTGFGLHAVGIVFTLLGRIEAALGSSYSVESVYPAAVRDALSYLRESYAKPFNSKDVAAMVGLSSARLRSLFQTWVGESPQQFHARHRIEQAKKLLEQRSMAIYEVAYHIGFTDARYFSRVFKQVTGKTPTQYLNQL